MKSNTLHMLVKHTLALRDIFKQGNIETDTAPLEALWDCSKNDKHSPSYLQPILVMSTDLPTDAFPMPALPDAIFYIATTSLSPTHLHPRRTPLSQPLPVLLACCRT